MKQYRILEKDEVIQPFDECDGCVDPLKDEPEWRLVQPRSIGELVPDPTYPAHTLYRRLMNRIYMADFSDLSIEYNGVVVARRLSTGWEGDYENQHCAVIAIQTGNNVLTWADAWVALTTVDKCL